MSGSLKIVTKYGTPEEAHLIKNRLEAAGIRAFLEGETMGAWGWHFSIALGGVKVLVAAEDFHEAERILAGEDEPDATAVAAAVIDAGTEDWTCPKCQAEVDAGQELCWACGAAADGVGGVRLDEAPPEAEPEEPSAPPPDVAALTILFPPAFAFFLFTKLCHFLAPFVPDTRQPDQAETTLAEPTQADMDAPAAPSRQLGSPDFPEPTTEEELDANLLRSRQRLLGVQPGSSEEELDAILLRSWRAAWIGLIMLPPLVMTFYSTWLLVKYLLRCIEGWHFPKWWRVFATFCLNGAVVAFVGFLLALALERYEGTAREIPLEAGPVEEQQFPDVTP